MRLKFTIGRKIGSGFTVLLITTLVIFGITYDTLRTGREINDKINEVYNPSVSSLDKLKSTILRSRTLINMWAFVQSREDSREKQSLVYVINKEIPEFKYSVDSLSVNWTDAERRQKEKIYSEMDKLLEMYSEVQSTLRDMRSYDDPLARFRMNEYAEDDGLIYQQAKIVIDELDKLIEEQQGNTVTDSVKMILSFDTLERYLKNMGVALFLFGVLIAILTVRSITRPVFKLKHILVELGKGKIPSRTIVRTGDEVGEMSLALDNLVSGLKRTTQFAHEVGKGHFETNYAPLSSEDVLGNALLVMRDGLKQNEAELERKVEERTIEVVKQKNRIERQNELHKELYENIKASIYYAKRLQDNILPSEEQLNQVLSESFIYFKPKDIVSGDFYFVKELDGGKVIFAAVDCTGHGVPGAFMSIVGHNALNRAISNNPEMDPARILGELNRHAANAFNRSETNNTSDVKDGMDIALCVYDKANNTVEYAGAYSPLYIVRENELVAYKADKIGIGSPDRVGDVYTTHRIQLKENDMMYVFSDGYADQFGGPRGKKFLYKPFRELLKSISKEKLGQQKKTISDTMEMWRKGGSEVQEQIDDILIIGVKHTSS